ncbi:hypothetical protein HA402_010513 [Bradysia odoriphaga]|nr:hypothetical protein HA402_010513 [Bradysia odoriphaga]
MMPSAKGKRPLRHLTACDKINAIQRIHDGESKASVARDIGVPESTLRGWCKNEEKLRYMSNNAGSDNKLTVDKLAEKMSDDSALAAAAAGMFGGPPEKRAKLDNSLNFVTNGKAKYDDMNFKSRNSIGAIDFSSSDKGLGALHYNGLGSTNYGGYKTSPDLSTNGRIKCEENMLRGYGADVKPSDPTKSDLSMAAISPLTSLSHLSGMSGIGQSPLGLSFNEIASNLSLIAQLNNQSNLANVAGLNNSQNNGLRTVRPKQMSQSLTVKNVAKLQHKNSAMDNIGMGVDMIDKPKKPSAASLSRDAPVGGALWYWIKHQQMLGLNNLYSAMPSSASPSRSSPVQQQTTPQQQQKPQSMMPSTTTSSTPPPLSLTPQTNSSTPTSDDTKNSSWFWQWCKYNQFGSAMMNNKTNCNNNRDSSKQIYDNILFSHLTKDMKECSNSPSPSNNNISNNANTPEDLSKPNRSSPITPGMPSTHSIKTEPELDINDMAGSPTTSPPILNDQSEDINDRQTALDNILYNNNNNNVVVKNESDVELNGLPEAVQYAEKFLKWLETYSDPTITALDFLQFQTLLNKIKKSAERINNPILESSKIRRRK